MSGKWATLAIANLPAFATLAYAAAIHAMSPEAYHRAVQEDEYIEWSSFWMFAVAGGANLLLASWTRRSERRLPWFRLCLAGFCFLVAAEEISWGQRLFAYRPPAYFLEHNFQQEMNLHNIMADGLRHFSFHAVVLGYGVILPLGLLSPRARHYATRLGLHSPPGVLVPTFLATSALYHLYPWSHSGEWAEMMFATGMLAAAAMALDEALVETSDSPWRRRASAVGLVWGVVLLLGVGTSWASSALTRHAPERSRTALIELEALRRDIAAARTQTDCGLHKRLYSFVEKYRQHHLLEGQFAALRARGLPEDRARFFLDPWNSPYWVQHICSEDRSRRAIFVYSFGPNRLRDSTPWEIVEDDLGSYVSRPEPVPKN